MKELDLERINETAPYKVFNTGRYHYYGFKTKADVVLFVGHDDDDLLGTIKSLAKKVATYYNEKLVPTLFKYQFLK